jgi:cell division protein FtsI (penicillin-binding protein 3)
MAMKSQHEKQIRRTLLRQRVLFAVICSGFFLLAAKLVVIQLYGHDRLIAEANARHVRSVVQQPVRGPIYDRNQRLLAVSTPVDTVWAEAQVFCPAMKQGSEMIAILKVKKSALTKACEKRAAVDFKNNFMYIKRQVEPLVAEQVRALRLPGIRLQRDYKRFYPSGPAVGQLIGFTDIDGNGQEGVEKAYNESLQGSKGKQIVHRDSKGRFVEFVEQVEAVENGVPLNLSIDSRLQYLASGYLEQAVRKHQARGGSAVMIYAPTGEILAMVDSPQFNPNDRRSYISDRVRNRAVTDVQEPGSTVKPFTIAAALESGRFTPESTIDTGMVPFRVPGGRISDTRPHGVLTLEEIVVKSSNIGAAKLSMEMSYDDFYETFKKVGFGQKVNAVPAEVRGVLPKRKRLIDRLTQSYGYGLNATPLQIARAYTVFANGGVLKPLTIHKLASNTSVPGERVFSEQTVAQVLQMLERVASPEGTARRARIDRYRVGGKTGTSRRNTGNGYEKGRYVSWFVGMAPMSDPKFVLAVMVDDPEPKLGGYYGGVIAGPVFAKTMRDTMRLYNIAPDKLDETSKGKKNMAADVPKNSGAQT